MLLAQCRIDLGQRVERHMLHAAELAPLRQPCLGEQDVGEHGGLAVTDAIAHEDRGPATATGLFDRSLLACAAAGARAAAVEVGELQRPTRPVDRVGYDLD